MKSSPTLGQSTVARALLGRCLLACLMLPAAVPALALTPDAPDRKPLVQCEPGPKADCANADLRFAVLAGLDLRGADFRGADLSRADLRSANLVGADFSNAILAGANLSRAYLATSKFIGSDLTGAVFDSARMSRSDFSGARFYASDLSGAWASSCNFANASFVNVDAQETKFNTSNFDGATMQGTRVRFAVFSGVNFGSCKGCPTDW